MTASTTALFVIDIQHALAIDPKERIPHADRLVAAAGEVVDAARAVNPPLIVFVQHEEKPENGCLVRGSEPWKLVFNPDQGAPNELLVHKTTRDTFESNPGLADTLKQKGITHIITCGIQSECCVESTSKGALAAGFQVSILRDAHSTYDDDGKSAIEIERAVEQRLEALGAKAVPYKDALAQWKSASALC